MWWLIGIALQTTKAVVPGSNPASHTVKNSEDRQRSHCVYLKISGQREGPPPERKRKKIYDLPKLALCTSSQFKSVITQENFLKYFSEAFVFVDSVFIIKYGLTIQQIDKIKDQTFY